MARRGAPLSDVRLAERRDAVPPIARSLAPWGLAPIAIGNDAQHFVDNVRPNPNFYICVYEQYRNLLVQSRAGDLNPPPRNGPIAGTFRWLLMESVWDAPFSPDTREKFVDFPVEQMTLKAVRLLRDRKIDFPVAATRALRALAAFSPGLWKTRSTAS
jgi:hypothetical protein